MTPSGSASVSADDLVLTTTQVPLGAFGLAFMGAGPATTSPFFDGVLCTGAPFFRFPIDNSGLGGTLTEGPGIVAYSQVNFPVMGQILAGSTWRFQHWYRDSASLCGTDANLSNGVSVLFGP